MAESRTENDLAYQEKLLKDRGWRPVYDDIHMRDPEYVYPILIGWLKEPSMYIYSTKAAFKKEVWDE